MSRKLKTVTVVYSCGHKGWANLDSLPDVGSVCRCWMCMDPVRVERVFTVLEQSRRIRQACAERKANEKQLQRWKSDEEKAERVSVFSKQTKRNLVIIKTFLRRHSAQDYFRMDFAFYRLYKLGFDYLQVAELATDFCDVFVSVEKVRVSVGRVLAWLCLASDECALRPLLEVSA